jgi:hypothetical protein
MPFCPSCREEYQSGTAVCPECQTRLVDALTDNGDTANLVDVFVCYDAQEADRALGLLTQKDIEALIRDRASTAFPMTVGDEGAQFVAVRQDQSELARTLLQEALDDSVLGNDGRVLKTS